MQAATKSSQDPANDKTHENSSSWPRKASVMAHSSVAPRRGCLLVHTSSRHSLLQKQVSVFGVEQLLFYTRHSTRNHKMCLPRVQKLVMPPSYTNLFEGWTPDDSSRTCYTLNNTESRGNQISSSKGIVKLPMHFRASCTCLS